MLVGTSLSLSGRFRRQGEQALHGLQLWVEYARRAGPRPAPRDFQLKQMLEILKLKLAKRGVDLTCLKIDEPVITGQTAKQAVTLRQGVDTELGKKIQRLIKDSKLKVQAAIQDKQVRVSGKNRDDLQSAIALVRKGGFDMPLQYTNFRD